MVTFRQSISALVQMREHFELTGARDDDNRGAAVGGPARP